METKLRNNSVNTVIFKSGNVKIKLYPQQEKIFYTDNASIINFSLEFDSDSYIEKNGEVKFFM